MDSVHDWNTRILNITLNIFEHYPELYRNLNEMYATLPIATGVVINPAILSKWFETLRILVVQYDTARKQ